jgi:hypothetical protein
VWSWWQLAHAVGSLRAGSPSNGRGRRAHGSRGRACSAPRRSVSTSGQKSS